MLVSDTKGRDVKIDAYTLSFHGRLLVENAEVSLNYGQRCVGSYLNVSPWRFTSVCVATVCWERMGLERYVVCPLLSITGQCFMRV